MRSPDGSSLLAYVAFGFVRKGREWVDQRYLPYRRALLLSQSQGENLILASCLLKVQGRALGVDEGALILKPFQFT